MNSVFYKLLTLALVTLVALPPGWCGACCRLPVTQVAAQPTCCQHAQPSNSSSSHGCPRPASSVGCCCTQPAIVPQPVVADDHLVALPTPAAIDSVAAEPNCEAPGFDQFIPPPGGLSLHVLQCVWRC